MHVAILHHEVAADASQDDRDVLVQADCVAAALEELGHQTSRIACNLNLQQLKSELQRRRPEMIFNLVETLGHTDSLAPIAPLLLEAMQQPFTGAPFEALWVTTSKLKTKRRLRDAGLPTADWLDGEHKPDESLSGRFILKAIFEHASFGMDDDAVVEVNSTSELRQRLSQFAQRLDRPCFAEQYVHGREFNLSLLGNRGNVDVLPPAEIHFEGFAEDKPKIVGYRAKWAAESAEFIGTPRSFVFPPSDRPLLEELKQLARRCWQQFHLRGYARVDFRVDEAGRPWILEINANPCLSPDAGYAAALHEAGISFAAAVERIIGDV